MVFARRRRLPWYQRLAGLFWPRNGFRRGATYVGYRLLRLPGTPHAIAGGFAWGAAVTFTPFIGLHIILAVVASWLTRCSVVAAVIGTALGNPWTFPLIWAWTYACGNWMLGGESGRPALRDLELLFDALWEHAGDWAAWVFGLQPGASTAAHVDLAEVAVHVLWPMTVGAVPNMVLAWLVFYLPLRRLVGTYQHRRRGHWRAGSRKAN